MKVFQAGGFLVGAAVGSGFSAQTAALGGADFLLAINAGRLRNMGVPSIVSMLPTHNASNLSRAVGLNEILPLVDIPVLLGVNCWVSDFDPESIAEELIQMGFAGAVNFPSSMHYPFGMRQVLDNAGVGYSREIELLIEVQRRGLKTLCYCGSRNQARAAASASIDMILYNYGWNAGGTLGHQKQSSLEEAGTIAREISLMVKKISPQSKFLLEGGSIVTADDLGYVAQHALIDGYVGGSTLDRLPFETVIANKIAGYRQAGQAKRLYNKSDAIVLDWAKNFGFVGRAPNLIHFLNLIKKMTSVEQGFAIAVEDGLDVKPIFNLLQNGNNESFLMLDTLTEQTPSSVSRLLLGQRADGKTELGALANPNLELVVIANAQSLSIQAQRRLSQAITSGVIYHPELRRQNPIYPKVVIITNRVLTNDGLLDGFIPEFANLFKGWTLEFPPLRYRSSDIPELLHAQMLKIGMTEDQIPTLAAATLQLFKSHTWLGNNVDIRNIVGLILSDGFGKEINLENGRLLLAAIRTPLSPQGSKIVSESQSVVDTLWRNGFSRTKTAEALGISRKTLYNKLKKYGIN
jgi:predicted TIM-barrel enzyme|tara:strand:- start:8534 stop:10264 length:1731 start_codon:yes stop_codon:yes gene_type:complete